MALKVVFVLLVSMLLFTKNNGEIVGGVKECFEECMPSCGEDKHCKSACAVACAFSATHNNVQIQTRDCNVGCSLRHCYKFLINKYDHDKFGGCMTSCNDNYCVDGKIALSKA